MPGIPASASLEWPLAPEGGALAHLRSVASAIAIAYVIYLAVLAVYRLRFHPLAKFPGPVLNAVSDLPYLADVYVGLFATTRAPDLHRRYGKVVRIGPNRLSVEGSVAWPEIYAHRPGGGETEYVKDVMSFASGNGDSLISASTKESHRRQRRILGHAFSGAAIAEQEPVITYYLELFLRRLSENARAGKAVDLRAWFNFLTFDIIGDLAFGESFGSLETSNYHFWVQNILFGVKGIVRRRILQESGMQILSTIFPDPSMAKLAENKGYAVEKAKARMALGAEPLVQDKSNLDADGKPKMRIRRDFMSYMLRKSGTPDQMTYDELLNNSNTLIVAGSETTATTLSTFAFQLGLPRHRALKEAVVAEVRSQFSSGVEISLRSVQANALPLLHACLEESLRIHPPVTEMPGRISPGAEIDGRYVPKGTKLIVSQLATFHNPEHFLDPESFRPQRFLPPDHPMHDKRLAEGSNMAIFKPFSFGPRDCLGKNLAYAELRLIAARFLFRFDFEFAKGTGEDWLDSQSFHGLWNQEPLMMRLIERKD